MNATDKNTICLNMIVKNEAHIIADTLKHLDSYIKFDYWVISDTGSTDATKEIIIEFFKSKNIPGELIETPWKDFGYNRSVALEAAYKKTDYVFVWDADDEIYGEFTMPRNLKGDSYKFIFGNASGFRYSRCQLFNNHKKWAYKGVLHEYAHCLESEKPSENILGNYYFISGRKGDRSKDPNKYLKDALVLEKAFAEAFEKKDHISNRYAFYCAQSYASCNMHEKAIEWYKKSLTLPLWIQERYICCLEIYDQYDHLKKPEEGLRYLVESFKYDSERVECFYRLIKYYCIHGSCEIAYMYYTAIQGFYENKYINDEGSISDKLFAKKDEHDFYLPYYMIIVGERTKHHHVCVKMFEIIVKQQYMAGEWWIRNLVHNSQFFIDKLSLDLEVLENFLQYINKLRISGVSFEDNRLNIIDKIIKHYRPLLATNNLKPISINKQATNVRVMLTVTTCKRFDLFEQTINSMLSKWLDIDKVDYWYCVDDNSSLEDRVKMQTQYPFFNYYMKSPDEKGHRESMNIIWLKLNEIKPTYWIHMEDDWLYFKNESYVTRAIQYLEKYKDQNIHQIVFNRQYGLMFADLNRVGGIKVEPELILHEKRDGIVGKNCGYWPHYSLQPSVIRTDIVLQLGNYTSANTFFERDYAERYNAKGYKTAFFNSIYSLHIGKQHWEKDGQNAYALNQVGQFKVETPSSIMPDTTIEITRINEPLLGNMTDHLHLLLDKIKNNIPFGLIRPSDGEYTILKGKTLTNCDNWTFKSGGILQPQLMDSIKTVNNNLYIGIPCNTCNKPWNCTDIIYNDYINTFKVPLAQRTYANIFGNANWSIFTDFLKGYTKGFFLITSGTKITDLPIKERFIIDEFLVNNWDTQILSETKRLLEYIYNKKGQLFCFSAGPLSKIWIPICMSVNATNTYLDVGASIDIFTKGTTNRLYTNKAHPFSKEICVFKDSIVAPVVVPTVLPTKLSNSKNLVYMCVFHNKDYLELLKILLITIKFYSRIDTVDFLILTSKDFESNINEISEVLQIPLRMKFFNFTTMHQASCARLFIFEYEDIKSYEKILYIDTDIIVQNDLTILFTVDIDNKIYAMKEGTIEHEYHGGWFFDFTTIDKNIIGMNGGILLFRNTDEIRSTFNQINNHIKELKDSNKPLPSCLDQPFINYHFIKKGLQDTNLLEKYGMIYCIDPPPPPSGPTSVILCHFVWPVGNALHKKARMMQHVSHILKKYINIHVSMEPYSIPNISNKSYIWNSGFIRFEDNNKLVTKWGNGLYNWLDKYTLNASWNGYYHVLKMSPNYDTYMSLNINNCEYVYGSLIPEFKNELGNTINIYLLEREEQIQAEKYISPENIVLELGARYGTVSCVINKKLNNSMNQVSVEPDKRVWACLEDNMLRNGCNFNILKGIISKTPMELSHINSFNGYGTRTTISNNNSCINLSLDDVEKKYKLKFDTLVADCEGFLEHFLDENPILYTQLNLILFEKDCPETCNYNKIIDNLKIHGFKNIVSGFHEVWKK